MKVRRYFKTDDWERKFTWNVNDDWVGVVNFTRLKIYFLNIKRSRVTIKYILKKHNRTDQILTQGTIYGHLTSDL
jgi:hypothetical protein